ncbi:MAG: leucine-rich repeat protein, partial [Oscillospiraceae bacterium]
MNKRLLSLLLACCFVFSLLPISAMADEAQTTSGSCGENVTWALVGGVLTISGTGDMEDYREWRPWNDSDEPVTNVDSIIIEDGVTSIGESAFSYFTNLKNVTIPSSVKRIGYCAFSECPMLKSISIPAGVETIEDGAFSICDGLSEIIVDENNEQYTSVDGVLFSKDKTTLISYPAAIESDAYEIPNGVTELSLRSFLGCTNIMSITVPQSVRTIGAWAFSDCAALEDVYYLGEIAQWKVINIDSGNIHLLTASIHCTDGDAFPDGSCGENVTWALVGGVLTISGTGAMEDYSSSGTAPWYDMADAITSIEVGDGVVSIGDHAFRGLRYVESAALAYSVESIGEYAFADCNRLYSIDMPAATDIGSYAFFNCFDLNSVSIPDGVATIRNSTFASCSNLRTVEIPESTTTVEDCAFNVCDSLSDVYYSGTRARWEEVAIGDCNIPLTSAAIHCSDDGDSYTGACGENVTWTLEGGILTISGEGDMESYYGVKAPWYNKADEIISIEVLSGVTSIGDNVFMDLPYVNLAAVSSSVKSVGLCAFKDCGSLENVLLEEGLLTISDSAFADCSQLQSIDIPDSVESIGDCAFQNCSNLRTITLPTGITSIGMSAFNGCTSLNNISIPEGVTTIRISAFASCSDLVRVDVPESMTSVESNAFNACDSLSYVDYSGTKAQWDKISIGDDNEPLTAATIHCTDGDVVPHGSCGDELTWKFENGKVTVSGTGAMYEFDWADDIPWAKFADEIKAVVIENGVTGICSDAFSYCAALESVSLPESLTIIGDWAFSHCSKLESITLPDGIQTIGNGAFQGCSSIKSVVFPNSVETIGNSSFANCAALESITLPKANAIIDEGTFARCPKLSSVFIPGAVYFTGNIFEGCTGLTEINIEDTNPDYCSVGGVVFDKDMTTLVIYPAGRQAEEYAIPNGVTTLPMNAFTDCVYLSSVTVPDSVEAIEIGAFWECAKLSAINVDENNEGYCSIDGVLFNKDKTTLISYPMGKTASHYDVPDGVMILSPDAFINNRSLQSVTIPASVTNIAYGALKFQYSDCVFSDIYYEGTAEEWKAVVGDDLIYYCLDGVTVHCTDEDILPNGTCGENVTWTLDGSTLTISGEGSMDDFEYMMAQWNSFKDRIESVVIEDGVTSIGDCAFVRFTNLKSISIPASVETIGFLPFDGCTSLERFDVAEKNAVYSSVDGVLFSKDKTTLKLYPRNKADTEYAIPDGVKTIAKFAFYECQNLQKLSLPASVETIDLSGVDICWSLTEINVAEDNTNYCSVDGVLFSKDRSTLISYPRGNTAEQYVIPDGTKTVENRSFRCSKYIRSVVIPASVESIGQITFYDCALTDVYFTGTQEQWDSILSQNEFTSGVDGATVHCDYVPPHTHSYTAVVTAPTCTEGGYTTYTCACGDSYVNDHIDALGHNYKKGVCTRCGEKDPNYIAAPVIKITTSAGKPKISWSKVDGAVKYQVYRSTDGKKYDLLATTTGTSITNTKAKIGTKYYYKVKAVNANGDESEFSNGVNIKCVPAAPTVTISRSGGKAKLSWKAVSGA